MATKAEKRARAEAKHAEFMEAQRISGLKAQEKDRARRAKIKKQKEAMDAAEKQKKENVKASKKLSGVEVASLPTMDEMHDAELTATEQEIEHQLDVIFGKDEHPGNDEPIDLTRFANPYAELSQAIDKTSAVFSAPREG